MQYFRLRDIYYGITEPRVDVNRSKDGITLDISLNGVSNDMNVDKVLRNVNLSINLETYCTNFYDLIGKHMKELSPKAGIFTINSDIPIEFSKITIHSIDDHTMTIHWSGEITLNYNKKYSKNIPFDLEMKALILGR